ncbi:class I SAM-dependent methyltransferase [Dyella subtropica]|uniref:class I SAM-dependent methyltransferase n=1 Tax=Dyella subtropica TaxID=2992127 RepID=UPI0022599746|nr:methyltransferase domain-containing protein [Dyella subtropica]
MNDALKLHLGSGAVSLAGWLNIDLEAPEADLRLDLRGPLPFDSASVSHIFSEHVIEHIEYDEALRLLQECRRVLRPDGVLRITTPDLAWLVDNYVGALTEGWGELWQPGTPARMINQGMRYWGHCFIYDRPEMLRIFRAAGFGDVRFVEWQKSDDPILVGLETRPLNNEIIVEARIPLRAESDMTVAASRGNFGRGVSDLLAAQGEQLENLRIRLAVSESELTLAREIANTRISAISAESDERGRLLLDLEASHRANQAEILRLGVDNARVLAENASLQAERASVQAEIAGLQAESARLEAENVRLRVETQSITDTVAELHGVHAELGRVRQELERVSTESEERAGHVTELAATLRRHEEYMARLRASLPGRILFRFFKSSSVV